MELETKELVELDREWTKEEKKELRESLEKAMERDGGQWLVAFIEGDEHTISQWRAMSPETSAAVVQQLLEELAESYLIFKLPLMAFKCAVEEVKLVRSEEKGTVN